MLEPSLHHLRAERARYQIRLTALAEAAGMSPQLAAMYLSGYRRVGPEARRRLAAAMNALAGGPLFDLEAKVESDRPPAPAARA